ncbi:hypothetical protein BH10ACT1_BH10ACT1_41030 [soil metagenome]
MTAPTTKPEAGGRGSPSILRPVAEPIDVRTLVATGVVVVLASVAGLELRRLFGWDTLLAPVVTVALAGAAGPLLARWQRLPAIVGPVAALVAGLVAVGATVPDAGAVARVLPGPELLRTVADAAVNGWAQITSTGIPAPPRPTMVLVAPLLAWAASWLGTEIVLRVRTPGLAALPAVTALVGASVLVVPAGGSRVPAAVLMVLGTGVLVVLGAQPDAGRGVPSLRPVRAAAMGVAVVLIGLVVAPHLPWIGDTTPKDPRPDDPTPEAQITPVNPLARLAGWAANPKPVVATVRGDIDAPVRLMVLDRYDGNAWTTSTVLQEAGSTLPPAAPGERAVGRTVRQQITLDELPGTLLPAPDRPVAYDGPDAWWDAQHGVLYRRQASEADDEVDYEVRSVLPVLPDQIGSRAVDDSDPRFTAAPGAPAALAALALEATPSGSTPYARALLLERFVRDRAVFDPDAPSGSSWRTLEFFLDAKADAGGRRGTSEQFASAFAALARLQGLPARVVVGARPDPSTTGGRWTIRAGDLEAWPEIRFVGIGWVPFDPTPAAQDDPLPTTTTTTSPTTTSPDLPPDQTTPERSPAGAGKADDAPGGTDRSRSLAARLGDAALPTMVVLAVLLLLAPFVVVAAKVLRRARRRRADGDAARVLGAWADVVDQLRSRGVDASLASSRRGLARSAQPVVGDGAADRAEDLALLANAVAFSGAVPPAGTGDRAWELADKVRSAAAEGQPRWRLAARRVDPRTLRPVRSLGARPARVPPMPRPAG